MKIGFTVTFHESSRIKEDGHKIGHKFIEALYGYCKYPFELFIVDNQSEPPFSMDRYEHLNNMYYTYVEDQYIGGLTTAWNLGTYQAYKNDCDLINICNNDMYFNETLDDYLKIILDTDDLDNTIFGPVSDGLNPAHEQQAPHASPLVDEAVGDKGFNNTLCGLMYTFTSAFFEKYRSTEEVFLPLDHKYNGGDGKWGGQEGAVMLMWERGAKMRIVRHGWFHHEKNFSYRTARHIDRGDY